MLVLELSFHLRRRVQQDLRVRGGVEGAVGGDDLAQAGSDAAGFLGIASGLQRGEEVAGRIAEDPRVVRAAGLSAIERLGRTDRLARGGEGGGRLAARFLELVLAVVRLRHPREEVAPAGLHLAETQGGPQALVHV